MTGYDWNTNSPNALVSFVSVTDPTYCTNSLEVTGVTV